MALTLDGTKGETFPTWTTAGRPASPNTGQTGYNTTLNALEYYDGTNWKQNYITSGTAQNSTSGTSIDFTGIPAGVKRITIILNGVSTNSTSNLLLQVGNGSFINTGYTSYASYSGGSNQAAGATSTIGLLITATQAAASTVYGVVTINNISGNDWVHSAVNTQYNGSGYYGGTGNGVISLSSALDRVRITTVTGTSTFDAGSINIMYE